MLCFNYLIGDIMGVTPGNQQQDQEPSHSHHADEAVTEDEERGPAKTTFSQSTKKYAQFTARMVQ
jgi:hypothetical protein